MLFHHFLHSCNCWLCPKPACLPEHFNLLQTDQLKPLAGMRFLSHSSSVGRWWAAPQQHSQVLQGSGVFPFAMWPPAAYGSARYRATAMTLAAHLCCPKRFVKSWEPESFVEQIEQTSARSSWGFIDPPLMCLLTESPLWYRQYPLKCHSGSTFWDSRILV